MKTTCLLGLLITLFGSGCSSINAPLLSKTQSTTPPTKHESFAFDEESHSRAEKSLFCERAREYLTREGYRMAPLSEADYVIRFRVFGPRHLKIRHEELASPFAFVSPNLLRTKTKISKYGDDRSIFSLVVYQPGNQAGRAPRLAWEVSLSADQKVFREHEEAFVLAMFERLGQNFDGEISIPKETTARPSPLRATNASPTSQPTPAATM